MTGTCGLVPGSREAASEEIARLGVNDTIEDERALLELMWAPGTQAVRR
jgi:hypothetical protein